MARGYSIRCSAKQKCLVRMSTAVTSVCGRENVMRCKKNFKCEKIHGEAAGVMQTKQMMVTPLK